VFDLMHKLVYSPFMDTLRSISFVNVVELIIIAVIIYKIYKYITGTQAEQLLKGILMLLLALVLTKVFRLQILGRVIESIVNIVIFSLVVIFQPELRRILGYLGQPGVLSKNLFSIGSVKPEVKDVITELVESAKYLSKSHIGALIVIKNTTGFENYIEVGTKLDARVSTELLLTIFHPNTPLHDGAVVIHDGKIVAAGVLLPLTENPTLSWQYGTRHRAAIGMSEVSDSTCIVVSEETGNISMAQGGILTKFTSLDDLRKELELIYGFSEKDTVDKSKFDLNNIFSK